MKPYKISPEIEISKIFNLIQQQQQQRHINQRDDNDGAEATCVEIDQQTERRIEYGRKKHRERVERRKQEERWFCEDISFTRVVGALWVSQRVERA